jgi:diguanylate cyclase (GGDEF)-like protein/PAS domain S-box-containing protein
MVRQAFKAGNDPEREPAALGLAGVPWETIRLNLPANSDSREQREILDALPVLVFLERAGRIVYANAEARHMLGHSEGEWIPRPVEEVLWGLFPGTAEPQTTLTGTKRGSPFHATMPGRAGRLHPVEGTYSLLNTEMRDAVIVAHLGGRERAPKSRLMEDVLASIPDAVAIEHGNHVLYTNPAFTRMFGFTAEEVSGGSLQALIVPETRYSEIAMLEKQVDERGRATVETVRVNKSGELVDVSLHTAPLLVNGAKVGYVYTFRDIGERKETEAKLQFDAMHDVLTGLPNRSLFMDRLSLAMSRRLRRADQGCGVLFLDLDHFKEINDTLGHAAGDVLLKAVSERLTGALRPQDSAARLGGDEFAVLLENIHAHGDLEIVANRILLEMTRPFEVFGHFLNATTSIGVAMAGPGHTSPDLLIRDADFAMYRAKQGGGGQIEFFDRHLELCLSSQEEREQELRRALDRREFEVWYEPVFRLENGALEGFEALFRVRGKDGSIEDFRELLAVAEETGLSITLGREMVEAVCQQLRIWMDMLPRGVFNLSIDVTGRQFYHPDLIPHLLRTLQESGVNPARLLFEVSEQTLNEDLDAAVVILQRMVDLNVRVAVDNFGSSLAPFNHLVQLPIDVVKMDPKLTAVAGSAGRQLALMQALVNMGHTVGVKVVARGIETREQLDALRRLGCEFGQGPFLSPAMETAQALRLAGSGPMVAPSIL